MTTPWLTRRSDLRAALRETLALRIKLRAQLQRHEEAMARWQRRIVLAEQHGEFDLATRAAQLARWHAAQVRQIATMLEAPPLLLRTGVERGRGDASGRSAPLSGEAGEGLGGGATWTA